MLCDTLGLTVAIERCRSRSQKIFMVIRRIAGQCLSRNIRLFIWWIVSKRNSFMASRHRFFFLNTGSKRCCFRAPRNVVLVGFIFFFEKHRIPGSFGSCYAIQTCRFLFSLEIVLKEPFIMVSCSLKHHAYQNITFFIVIYHNRRQLHCKKTKT